MSNDIRYYQDPQLTPPPRNWLKFGLGILILVGLLGFAIRCFQNMGDYSEGQKSYQAGNCQEAIASFDRIIKRWMPVDVNDYKVASQAKKSECAVFQKAVNLQESEKFSDALIGYNDFITRYSSSALLPAVQRQTESLLLNADETELAQAKVCEKVEVFKKN